jgi:hypothetical protein
LRRRDERKEGGESGESNETNDATLPHSFYCTGNESVVVELCEFLATSLLKAVS